MANGTPDFRFRNQLNVAGIAGLLADKKSKEEQIKASQQRRRNENIQLLLQSVQLGSNLASQGIARSQAKQERQARASFADLLGQSATLTPTGQTTQAQSSLFPQLTEAAVSAPRSQTPEFQAQLRQAAARVSPGSAAQAVLQQRDPLKQEIRLAELEKIRAQTAKAKRPPKPSAGEQRLSEFATRKVLKDAGFTKKEIREGVTKNGGLLPKRIKKRDADALKGKAGFSFNFGGVAPDTPGGGSTPTADSVSQNLGF